MHLAIDQGGHASRALLFDAGGQVVARAETGVPVHQPQPGWVEQDAEQVVRSVQDSIDQAINGRDPAEVVNAGLACQRSSVVCWSSSSGEALSPVISWQDRRAHAWLARFEPQRARIHQSTGLMLSAHYGASKLRWCLDNLPAVRDARERGELCLGPLASFLVFRLTAERSFLADPANAARTLLYDLESRDWNAWLLELFGIPRALLPRCVSTRSHFGRLDVAGHNVPLAIVTGDQSAALFASGPPLPAVAYVNIGTGAFVQRPCVGRLERHPNLLTSVVLDERGAGTYVLEATVNGAGSALEWVRQELGIKDLEGHLENWLEQPADPPLFLNGISGLAAPFWVADFSSRFVGSGEPWQKVVAVAESIIFLLQINIEELRRLAPPLEHVVISGGLAEVGGLCQRLADITRLPVCRPVEHEATARGVAYLLVEPVDSRWKPNAGKWFWPEENPALSVRYARWRAEMALAVGPASSGAW